MSSFSQFPRLAETSPTILLEEFSCLGDDIFGLSLAFLQLGLVLISQWIENGAVDRRVDGRITPGRESIAGLSFHVERI